MTDPEGPGQKDERRSRQSREVESRTTPAPSSASDRWATGRPKPAVRAPSSSPARKMPGSRPAGSSRVVPASPPTPAAPTHKGVLNRPAVRRPSDSAPVISPKSARKPKTDPRPPSEADAGTADASARPRGKRDIQGMAQMLADQSEVRDRADARFNQVETGPIAALVRSRLWISILLMGFASYYALVPVVQEAGRRADEAYLADVIEHEAKRIGQVAGKGNLAVWIQEKNLAILRNFYRVQSEKLLAAVKHQGFEQATAAHVGLRVDFEARTLVVSARFGGSDGRLVAAAATTDGKRVGHPPKETGLEAIFWEQAGLIAGTFGLAAVLIIPLYLIPLLVRRRERTSEVPSVDAVPPSVEG